MKETLASFDVFYRLLLRIISLDYLPGQKIDMQRLCRAFQLSRTPVRDAIWVLDEYGLVELEPQQSTKVTLINEAELSDDLDMFFFFLNKAEKKFLAQGKADDNALHCLEREKAYGKTRQNTLSLQHAYAFVFNLFFSVMSRQQLFRYCGSFANTLRVFSANVLLRHGEEALASFNEHLVSGDNPDSPLFSFLNKFSDFFAVEPVKDVFPEFFCGFGRNTMIG